MATASVPSIPTEPRFPWIEANGNTPMSSPQTRARFIEYPQSRGYCIPKCLLSRPSSETTLYARDTDPRHPARDDYAALAEQIVALNPEVLADTAGKSWSGSEVKATVADYFEMLRAVGVELV